MPRLGYLDSTAAPTPIVAPPRLPPLTSLREALAHAACHVYGPRPDHHKALCVLVGWVVPNTLRDIDDDYLNTLVSLLDRISDMAEDAGTAHVVVTLVNRLDPSRLSTLSRHRCKVLQAWGLTWPRCSTEPDPLRFIET